MTMDFDLQRFAIKNTESNTFVMGTVFDDSINNTGSNVTINSDVGDDSIISYGNNVWIDSGVGDDSVHNDGSNVTIYANVGDDTILTHNGSNVLINCSTGDDSVSNFDSKVTIFGETGDDSIHLNSNTQDNMVDAGIGDDYILSFSDNSTLLGGIGDDTIKTGAKAYSTSNDSLQAENVSKYVFIDGGEGNDSIFSNGENATISGDLGNDFVSLSSVATNNLIIYNPGDGNDTIRGINASSTLRIGNGKSSYSSTTSGSNVIVTVGKGKITLEGAKGIDFTIQGNIPSPKKINNSSNNTLLTGSTFNDTITNSGGNVTINAGGGNDSITLLYGTTLESNKVTVDAGGGADTVLAKGNYLSVVGGGGRDSINGHHNYGTIKAGADNDTIVGNHYRSKLYGDSGNDLISITSYWYDTISGGTGNDTIAVEGGGNHSISGGKGADRVSLGSATSSTIYYAQGDGNDTVWGFDSTDVLSINGSYTNKKSENDVIVTVGNSKITFKDAAKLGTMTINNKTIKIGGEEEKVTQQDVIKTFMATLDKYGSSSAKTALDKAVDAVSNYKTINEAITAMVNDCKYAASSDDFLKNKCGIDLDNYDTGAITGSDAGGTLKTAKSIIPESGTKQSLGSDYIAYYVWYDDKNSGAVINYKDVGNVTKDKQHIMDCMYTWWSSEALKLIEESYGYSFNDSNAKYKVIYLQFADNADYRAANGYYGNDQKLIINLGCYNNLASDDYDAESPNGQGYLDRTFTHELTHAIMRSKLENFSSLPQFIKEGVADLTHGSDDDRGSYMEDLAGNSDYLASKLKVSDNSTGDNPTYAAGYMFLRWLAKQNATINDSSSASAITATQKKIPKGISVKNSTMTVSTKFTGDKINLGDYNANITKVDASVFNKTIKIFGNKNNNLILSGKGSDYLSGGAGTDKIAGNAGNDVISGGTGNNSLNGGAGNDTLYSGTGNNTLTGGKGNDVFFYEGGKLLITDYAAGDKIKISGDKISKSEVKQGYVIFTTSGGSISVKGGASKKIALIDKDDKTTSKVYGSTLKVTKSPVTLGAAYINANASSAKIAVMITGNANNNSILGGAKNDTLYGGKGADTLSGGAGNDSLWGGADNDSLWGGKGKDTFIYKPGEGTDTIFDYASGDMLKILKSNGKTGGTFKDSSFGSGKLTLTINGGGKVIFNDVSSSDTFNINGKIHTISGKKLK